jgi:hypothetical protein
VFTVPETNKKRKVSFLFRFIPWSSKVEGIGGDGGGGRAPWRICGRALHQRRRFPGLLRQRSTGTGGRGSSRVLDFPG